MGYKNYFERKDKQLSYDPKLAGEVEICGKLYLIPHSVGVSPVLEYVNRFGVPQEAGYDLQEVIDYLDKQLTLYRQELLNARSINFIWNNLITEMQTLVKSAFDAKGTKLSSKVQTAVDTRYKRIMGELDNIRVK